MAEPTLFDSVDVEPIAKAVAHLDRPSLITFTHALLVTWWEKDTGRKAGKAHHEQFEAIARETLERTSHVGEQVRI